MTLFAYWTPDRESELSHFCASRGLPPDGLRQEAAIARVYAHSLAARAGHYARRFEREMARMLADASTAAWEMGSAYEATAHFVAAVAAVRVR
jgi:hypothetical protein